MRKILHLAVVLFTLMVCNAQAAQGGPQQGGNQPPQGKSGGNEQASSTDSSSTSLDESFAKVAALGQQIALAQKEAEALQMQQSLSALKAKQTGQKVLGFKIVRIEGFDKTLYAVLMNTNGAMQQVGPGEQVNDSYRVSLITASTVKVVDLSDNKVYTVPFYSPANSGMGSSGAGSQSGASGNQAGVTTTPQKN